MGVRVASVMLSPYMVARTPMLAVLPQVFARHFASFLPLRVLPTPFEVPPFEVSMVWHARTHRVGMQQWLRGLVRDVVEEQVLPQTGS
jgi:DNA-binding transcriptional LysR family regulator